MILTAVSQMPLKQPKMLGQGIGEYMSLCTDPISRNLVIRNASLLPSSVSQTCLI